MKTQINTLRSGIIDQIVDENTQKIGTNKDILNPIWEQVKKENPEFLKIEVNFNGEILEFTLKANWSLSRLSCWYFGSMKNEDLIKFGITKTKNKQAHISISSGNIIQIHNGGKSFTHICPSFITIK